MSNYSPLELLGFSPGSDTSSRLDQRIDRMLREPTQRSAAAARVRDRGIDLQQINFVLQVYLDDLPVVSGPRKMRGGTFMEKQMQDDSIKCRILRVPVSIPVRDMHVQFDIALEDLFSIHADGGVNEIRARFAIPESELDNFNDGTSD